MALPHGTTGSLGPAFAPARLAGLTVRPPSTLALSGGFPSRLRGPLGASVTLWEATAPVKLPAKRCPHFRGLGPQPHQGGISPAPPPPPKGRLHRLPPILRRCDQEPTPGCSKAPRGLFVLPRVGRIFTASSISPGPSPRQRSGRYAFRAGRNLPDKEFRYLRTVIVTAAVHRGFGSGLAPLPLTFRHRASVAPYTSSYEFAESCVFGKQSPEPVHCGSSQHHEGTAKSTPSPEVTGLTCRVPWRGFSRAPECSRTRPPVSVCGTGSRGLCLEAFLGSLASEGCHLAASPPRRAHGRRICLPPTLRFWPGSSMAPVPLA